MKKVVKIMKNIIENIRFFCLAAAVLFFTGCSDSPSCSESPDGNYTFRLPGSVKLEMVKIKAGSFMMGTPQGELGRSPNDNEEKLHQVTLEKDYWLGKYEVTNAQYEAVMPYGGFPKGFHKYPVQKVRWRDAKEFCDRMNELFKNQLPPGYHFDLPTEAQWEYACRAGTTTALNSGKNLTSEEICPNMGEVGWYFGNSYGLDCDASVRSYGAHPVGEKKPNAWGLFDMHGNVREWCLDSQSDARFVRGGYWYDYARACRSGVNDFYLGGAEISAGGNQGDGFRLALVPVQ
ncbi:MAG: formylglycine-generating enzyme family protein [Lentisphaeria bacterium]|nr:formylglycine-generating enzyme family protein [Lentisphaeria bacterium]